MRGEDLTFHVNIGMRMSVVLKNLFEECAACAQNDLHQKKTMSKIHFDSMIIFLPHNVYVPTTVSSKVTE